MARREEDTRIDFVITWVDSTDTAWQRERGKFAQNLTRDDIKKNSEARYRDMELLKYWFRGVEKFAPWVNKIFFVTCGQTPPWLNINHPKLKLVKHTDYIPQDCLPTFNSNAIELGMHRITGLSEKFVYFNDDVFFIAPTEPTHFFRKELPCDMYEVKALVSFLFEDGIDFTRLNNLGIINSHFFGRNSKLSHFGKKLNCCYPIKVNLRNLYSIGWKGYIGIADPHVAMPYLKSDFEAVWDAEPEPLSNTCYYKFRSPYDVNHWIFRYWRLIQGRFSPVNLYKTSRYFLLRDNAREPADAIRSQKYKVICLNDNALVTNFDAIKVELQAAFSEILPEQSSFEKTEGEI